MAAILQTRGIPREEIIVYGVLVAVGKGKERRCAHLLAHPTLVLIYKGVSYVMTANPVKALIKKRTFVSPKFFTRGSMC